ncbi:MAG TPA: 3-hydroxyacyl-CoA dehydrogenase family protein [Acidimicrobiia bacterium]|nr:3-hydroxyacyl-CoA dehydrogenase family protein [Acidimicrobiia bacterium]
MSETRVTVIGGGIMGAGIAFVTRACGLPVTIVESEDRFVDPARERVEHYEGRAGARGDALEHLGPLSMSTALAAAVADADVVVEAVSEDLALKRSVWEAIGAAAMDHAVLASNTSGLPVQVLGAAAGRPAQVLGLHFFNPVPAMSLVEVIRAPDTDDVIVERALAFCATLGKETIEVRDLPGFITTRLGTLLMCEAIRALQEGVASAADIDTGMRLGYNHPVGPLALADRIGLDTLLSILDDLRVAYGDAFRAPPLLRQMVEAGRLGRKGGRGFYEYS